ncbi:MAG: thioredoxin family protein [Candidatus Hydrothermarchaeaceae archaeon]
MARTRVTVFTMPECPKCPAVKELVEEIRKDLDIDIDEVDLQKDRITGLQYGVASTPSVAVNEKLISRGDIPDRDVLIAEIKRAIG